MRLIDELIENPIFWTLLGIIISAIISIFVARHFGEIAATNLSIREARRRDHHLRLIGPIMDSLQGELEGHENAVSIRTKRVNDELEASSLLPLEFGQIRDASESDLLLSHLETGYRELFIKLKDYRDQYNDLQKRIVRVGDEIIEFLKKQSVLPPYSGRRTMTEYCRYARAVEVFVTMTHGEWQWQREQWQLATVSPTHSGDTVYYQVGWTSSDSGLARTSNIELAEKMRDKLNKLIGSKFHDALTTLYSESVSLRDLTRKIEQELQQVRVMVTTGVPLGGSCIAGTQAKPKLE